MEDASNADTAFTRNWIRHSLIPMMEQQNPRISQSLARTAELLGRDEDYLQDQARQILEGFPADGTLPAGPTATLPPAIRSRVIRLFLEECGGLRDLGQTHIRQLESLLGMQNGRRVTLPGGRTWIKDQGRIRLMESGEDQACAPAPVEPVVLPADGQPHAWGQAFFTAENVCRVPLSEGKIPNLLYTKWLSCDTITGSVNVRTRQPGDFLFVGKGRKSLQDYMVDAHIPLSERDRIPLLACGSHILWIVGYRISDRCRLPLADGRGTDTELEINAVRVQYTPCRKEETS